MTPTEFHAIRKQLGLTQAQLAPLLGYGAAPRVSAIESGPKVPKQAALLMEAYRTGYRPKHWPLP